MNKNRRASLPTKCLITIDITHLDNSFEVPDESKPFSTYDTKHLFFFQLGKKQFKQKTLSNSQKKKIKLSRSWNSRTKILHTEISNSESTTNTNCSRQKVKIDFNKNKLINVIRGKTSKKNNNDNKKKSKKNNNFTCSCIIF